MKKYFLLAFTVLYLLILSLPGYSSDEPEFTLNRFQDVQKGKKLTFYENELADQRMEIRKPTPPRSINMHISLDGGDTWSDMDQRADYYVFWYDPNTEDVMHIMFSWTDEDGMENTRDTQAVLTYIANN